MKSLAVAVDARLSHSTCFPALVKEHWRQMAVSVVPLLAWPTAAQGKLLRPWDAGSSQFSKRFPMREKVWGSDSSDTT